VFDRVRRCSTVFDGVRRCSTVFDQVIIYQYAL
jgi:mRNA-degrading endonuclease YafQ of YafQ-DinJ toxin-antitoxin module